MAHVYEFFVDPPMDTENIKEFFHVKFLFYLKLKNWFEEGRLPECCQPIV